MNLKTLATLAAAIVTSTAWAASPAEQKCGAGTCGKKEASCKPGTEKCPSKEAACSKKDASCAKK
jgi:hypothetical protein